MITTRRDARGSALAILLLVLAVLLVLLVAVVAIGARHSRMAQANLASVAAVQSAEAAIHAGINQLSGNSAWNAGFTNAALGGEQDQKYSLQVTNNLAGTGPVTAPSGVSVPQGTVYLLATGTSKGGTFSRQVAVFLSGGTPFSYASASGGTVSMGASGDVYGTIKSNDRIVLKNLDLYPVNGEGRLLGSAEIDVQGIVKMKSGQDVRARGKITGQEKISGASVIVQYDTTPATAPFIVDGRITNNAPAGQEAMPNPDVAALLASAVTHNQTTWDDALDLDGKVHYFPNGVTFGSKTTFSGSGTVVAGNQPGNPTANRILFNCVLKNPEMNVVVLDGQNGLGGNGQITFGRSTAITGLIFSHGNITSQAQFTVKGRVIAYGSGQFVNTGANLLSTMDPQPCPGFEAFFGAGAGGGGLSITSWQRL